ncbi:MAG: hypothetical protein Q7S52_05590 [bacterium]|nr:hypothetical protein [bacterium]
MTQEDLSQSYLLLPVAEDWCGRMFRQFSEVMPDFSWGPPKESALKLAEKNEVWSRMVEKEAAEDEKRVVVLRVTSVLEEAEETLAQAKGLARAPSPKDLAACDRNFVLASREQTAELALVWLEQTLSVVPTKFGRVYPPKLLRKFVRVKSWRGPLPAELRFPEFLFPVFEAEERAARDRDEATHQPRFG